MIEYHNSRLEVERATTNPEIRGAAGRFGVEEVRTLLAENSAKGLKAARDLRLLGCPEAIFVRFLERRARAVGFTVAAAPAITDEDRRAAAARTAALIAADNEAAELERERLSWYPKF